MTERHRSIAALDAGDFTGRMDSGSLENLTKTGAGEFAFDVQSRDEYGPQGSLMVWFHGACDLRGCRIEPGDSLRMTVRKPNRLQHIRPVYSYDAASWSYVPEGWAWADEELRFEVPLQPGWKRVFFAAHFPYPSRRIFDRAECQSQNPLVRELGAIGHSERGRPIPILTIADPDAPDEGKQHVLLSAGSHAGETASLWGMEGIIAFLLSGESASMLKRAVFHIVPMLNVDGAALGLDRRQATGVNIYFDYRRFESAEARAMWDAVKRIRPALWLDLHSWHLGVAEGAYGPDAAVVGREKFDALVKPLAEAVGRHFPINRWGADTLDCPNTQALIQLDIPSFCPEFNMGKGADGRWKTIDDQKKLGVDILHGVDDYLLNLSARR